MVIGVLEGSHDPKFGFDGASENLGSHGDENYFIFAKIDHEKNILTGYWVYPSKPYKDSSSKTGKWGTVYAEYYKKIGSYIHSAETFAQKQNQIFHNEREISYHGGYCTCPDGNQYWVSAVSSDCQDLNCVGGHQASCGKGEGFFKKVVCTPKADDDTQADTPKYNTRLVIQHKYCHINDNCWTSEVFALADAENILGLEPKTDTNELQITRTDESQWDRRVNPEVKIMKDAGNLFTLDSKNIATGSTITSKLFLRDIKINLDLPTCTNPSLKTCALVTLEFREYSPHTAISPQNIMINLFHDGTFTKATNSYSPDSKIEYGSLMPDGDSTEFFQREVYGVWYPKSLIFDTQHFLKFANNLPYSPGPDFADIYEGFGGNPNHSQIRLGGEMGRLDCWDSETELFLEDDETEFALDRYNLYYRLFDGFLIAHLYNVERGNLVVLFGKKVGRGIRGIFTTLKSKPGMANVDYGRFKIIDAPLYGYLGAAFPVRSHLFGAMEYLVHEQTDFEIDLSPPLEWLHDNGLGMHIKKIRYVYSQLHDEKMIAYGGNF